MKIGIGTLISLATVFSLIWAGTLWIKDSRDEIRSAKNLDSLTTRMEREVAKYQNVYSFVEQEQVISRRIDSGFADLKIYFDGERAEQKQYLDEQEKKRRREAEAYKAENTKLQRMYQTAAFIDNKGNKYILLGEVVNDTIYVINQIPVSRFQFEPE